MNRLRSALVAVILSAVMQAGVSADEPSGIPNLSTMKAKFFSITSRARTNAACQAKLPQRSGTSTSDFDYERAHDFGFDALSYNADVKAERFPAIGPTLTLERHIAAEGIAVVFITGRRAPLRSVTLQNLERVGYVRIAGLFLRPSGDRRSRVIPFKSNARRTIANRGYTILASIGDQWSDLKGGYAEHTYKLPNPMYLIP